MEQIIFHEHFLNINSIKRDFDANALICSHIDKLIWQCVTSIQNKLWVSLGNSWNILCSFCIDLFITNLDFHVS